MRPEGKLKTNFFPVNATRSPPSVGSKSGDASLSFSAEMRERDDIQEFGEELHTHYPPNKTIQNWSRLCVPSSY